MRLRDLRNLGPTSEAMLVEVGVTDPASLREVGPVEAHRRLRERFGRRATANFLFAMQGALDDVDWRELSRERRARLKAAAGLPWSSG